MLDKILSLNSKSIYFYFVSNVQHILTLIIYNYDLNFMNQFNKYGINGINGI